MITVLRIISIISSVWVLINPGFAQTNSSAASYHDYWLPQFQQHRLSYCLSDRHNCGKTVADRYCRNLGYERAQTIKIDHNVGLTSYFDKKTCCRGWHCAGFKLIRCELPIRNQVPRQYHYRYKKYVLPRFHQHRVAWCYQDQQYCGKRAASAFCRHMGYAKATKFQIETHLAATQSLGNQQLCFGDCNGFSAITCFR